MLFSKILFSFQKRKTANIRDYLALPKFAKYFDGFVRNGSTIETCCDDTERMIKDLREGSPIGQDTAVIAGDLCRQAEEKNKD